MPERDSLFPMFRIRSRRFLLGVILALLSAAVQLAVGAWYTSVVVFSLLFLLMGSAVFRLPAKAQPPITVLVFVSASALSFLLTQFSQGDPSLVYLDVRRIVLGVLLAGIVLLFFLLLTARPFVGVCIGTVFLLSFATVDYYVFKCRGTEFAPSDILSIATAGNVMAEYDFAPNLFLVRAWMILLLFLFGVSSLHLRKRPRLRLTLVSIPLMAAMIFAVSSGSRPVGIQLFKHEGTYLNGYLLNFTLQIPQSFVHAPAGYSAEALQAEIPELPTAHRDAAPDIIVIMNESFADFSVIGPRFQTDAEVMPFFRSMTLNTVKGFALAPVFGGGTSNSEFEFLTGHSMAFLPARSNPYQQHLKEPVYSMVSALKSRGYTCIAMHPGAPTNWNRNRVYPLMGFDETVFLPDFEEASLLRGFTSDQSMYEELIRRYEQHSSDQPLFIFGITMQNHGGFSYDAEEYPSRVHLEGLSGQFPDVEQFLTLIHDSDAAFAELVEYFSRVEDDVVLVFFGDHMPRVDSGFYAQIHDASAEPLGEIEKEYMVPYAIWTNYDSPAQSLPLTSLNYLSNTVYEVAGLDPPPYSQMLMQIQERVPALNPHGYYSQSSQAFLPLSEADGEEGEALSLYSRLVYNAIFDKRGRLSIFSTDLP